MFNVFQIKKLIALIYKCKDVALNSKTHPELDLFIHLVQCFNMACEETFDTNIILAAALHDIGKCQSVHRHAIIGYEILKDLNFIPTSTLWLVKNHMNLDSFIKGKKHILGKHISAYQLSSLTKLYRIDKGSRKRKDLMTFDIDKFFKVFS